jgi:hypothetical protein
MIFSPLLRWLTGASKSSRTSADPSSLNCKPRCEVLEDRIVPTWVVNNLTAVTPLSMALELVGPGVSVSNVQFTGANVAAGKFTESNNVVGIQSGVILSSGSVKGVAGPNNTSSFTTINNTPSDPQLDAIIAPTPGHDAAVLNFDWVPKGNVVLFSYVFGSEEYPEFVGSFNDVFAFFLNGKNVTFIPGTPTPVSINNVNGVTNSPFFVNNNPGPPLPGYPVPNPLHDTQMDGYTTVLTAVLIVKPGSTNHVKIAIEDAGDSAYDSWVLIKTNSLAAAAVGSFAPLRYTYSASTALYSGNFSVVNSSPVNIPGPLFLIFNSLPPGVTLANATGVTPSGKLYITLPGGTLKAGSAVGVVVKFHNPLHKNLGTFFIHSGSIDLTNILT